MQPPGLSILWETVDPREALQHRLGWAGFDQATEWNSTTLAEAWGVTVHDCRRLVISADNAIAWAESDRGRAGDQVVTRSFALRWAGWRPPSC